MINYCFYCEKQLLIDRYVFLFVFIKIISKQLDFYPNYIVDSITVSLSVNFSLLNIFYLHRISLTESKY